MENNTVRFVNSHDFYGDKEYVAWLQEIKDRYRSIKSRAVLQSNYAALEFNWLLGRDIVEKKAESKWGDGVVDQLSLDLRESFPDVKGFSSRNLYYMKQWYEFYCGSDDSRLILHQLGAKLQDAENQNPIKLHQLGAEIVSGKNIQRIFELNDMLPVFGVIPWKHHIYIITHCKSLDEAFYYVARTIDEGLSRKELEDIVDNNEYDRHGKALTNFIDKLSVQHGKLAVNVLKDPYNLDFLSLQKGYDEHDLEMALSHDMVHFLLELGNGFTFVGRQPELIVNCDGYFPDLLFYHIRLRCYVVIELKVVEFMPEFAGKLNFYVTACNKLLRQPDDNPTIGLLICKSKDNTKVEWAFDSIQNPMGVATYNGIRIMDKLPSVEALQHRLEVVEQELENEKRKTSEQ